jgi:hypothetical protein
MTYTVGFLLTFFGFFVGPGAGGGTLTGSGLASDSTTKYSICANGTQATLPLPVIVTMPLFSSQE